MERICTSKELVLFLYDRREYVNLTTHADGRYELGGFEGKFLQLLFEFLGLAVKIFTPDNMEEIEKYAPNFHRSRYLSFEKFGLSPENLGSSSDPYEMLSVTFAVKKSVPLATRFSFLYPFTLYTWLAVFFTLIFISAFGMLLMKRELSYSNLCLQMAGCLFRQCYQVSQNSLKIRIFFLFWLFFTMVISYSYSAVFFSFMLNPLKHSPVKNFQELSTAVAAGTHKCYFHHSVYALKNIRESEDLYIKKLAKIVEKNNYYLKNTDTNTLIESYIHHGNAVVRDRPFLDLMFGMNSDIFISDDGIGNTLAASFIFHKSFCWKKKLNVLILRAWTAGLYQKFLRDEQMKLSDKATKTNDKDSVRPLSLNDISGLIIIFLFGIFVSFFVFIMEVIVHNLKKLY